MKTTVCPHCEDFVDAAVTQERETYPVRGEPIEVQAEVVVCPRCGNNIFDEERDSKNLETAYNEYRKRHGLLPPTKIRQIRQKYGLSQRALSRLLGWGEVTLHRYENGALPDSAHNTILSFIEEPDNMRTIIETHSKSLTNREGAIVLQRIDQLAADEMPIRFRKWIEKDPSNRRADHMSGYMEFDLDKFKSLALYISRCYGGVLKTKLNKLMFFIDFLSFKETSRPVTGSRYVHLQYGPVPHNYATIIEEMEGEKELELEEIPCGDYVGEQISALTSPNMSLFSEMEICIMSYVCERFRNVGSGAISDQSHQEAAYQNAKDREFLSYEDAKHFSLSLPEG